MVSSRLHLDAGGLVVLLVDPEAQLHFGKKARELRFGLVARPGRGIDPVDPTAAHLLFAR